MQAPKHQILRQLSTSFSSELPPLLLKLCRESREISISLFSRIPLLKYLMQAKKEENSS
jgi:hypothetical protein